MWLFGLGMFYPRPDPSKLSGVPLQASWWRSLGQALKNHIGGNNSTKQRWESFVRQSSDDQPFHSCLLCRKTRDQTSSTWLHCWLSKFIVSWGFPRRHGWGSDKHSKELCRIIVKAQNNMLPRNQTISNHKAWVLARVVNNLSSRWSCCARKSRPRLAPSGSRGARVVWCLDDPADGTERVICLFLHVNMYGTTRTLWWNTHNYMYLDQPGGASIAGMFVR